MSEKIIRQALYHLDKGNIHRMTKKEAEEGVFYCPRCRQQLQNRKGRFNKILMCNNEGCNFVIREDQITDKKPQIILDQPSNEEFFARKAFLKDAKPLKKSEYTPEVEALIDKTKKYFPFISKVYDVAKSYIIEVGFDGLLTGHDLKTLAADRTLAHLDVISPKKLQVVWAKK